MGARFAAVAGGMLSSAFFAAAAILMCAPACQFVVDGEIEVVRCQVEGRSGPPNCPEGFVCADGTCTANDAEVMLGGACSEDSDCEDGGVCLQDKALAGDAVGTCSRPCCSSTDCGPIAEGYVCWVPEVGGLSLCRRASQVAKGGLGEAKAGTSCDADDQCRSGRCVNEACLDVCCSNTNCATQGNECRIDVASTLPLWSCGETDTEKLPYLGDCEVDEECQSGLCVDFGGVRKCSVPCCSSAECGSSDVGDLPAQVGCSEVLRSGGWVKACAALLPVGAMGAVGVKCTDSLECRSGQCLKTGGDVGYCTDTCCSDANCGDPATFRCTIVQSEAPWALRCEAK